MNRADIIIVGGGVAGGAAACAFAGRGLNVMLFERRDLSRDPNRGDALEVDTVRALESIGAKAELERRGAVWARRAIFTSGLGNELVQTSLGENARLILNHAEIEAGLLQVAKDGGVDVRYQTVTGIRREAGRWRVEADGQVHEPRLLIAADGARSMIREYAGIDHPGWDYDHSVVILHGQKPGWMEEDMAWLIHHRRGAVVVLPTTPRGRCRVIVTVPKEEAAEWMREEASVLQSRLAERSPRLGEVVPERLGGSHIYRVARRHASRYVEGSMVLIGDAAHVTHPMGGWGMNLAIRDATHLAEFVGPALKEDRPEEELHQRLREYEKAQHPKNERTLRAAHRASKVMAPGPIAYAFGKLLLALFSPFKGERKLPLMR